MIKGSQIRKADCAIEPLLLDRWSPRAMSGEEISQEELTRLFEAARWAPSSFNAQQWRALYARRGTEDWQTFFDLLVDANKVWAKNAAVLVVFISRKIFDHNDEPSVTHSYDAGAAWENFALQGFHQGLVVHGMEGFDYEAHAKNFESLMSFKSKQWRQSANLGGKNGCLKSCRLGKVRMIGANFPIAFSKDRLGPDRNYSRRHSPDQPNDQNLDPFQSETLPAGREG